MFDLISKRIKHKTFLSLVFIVSLSFVPRVIMLFSRRLVSFGGEQGMDLLFVKDIVVNHAIYLIGYNTNYVWHIPKGPGWYYLLSIPFILGNGDPFWAKAMTGIISIATVILSFNILRSGFGLKSAIMTGMLLAISPWLIEQTGQIWPPYIVIFPTALFLFSVMKVLQKKQKYVALIALSIGLMLQFEISIGYFYIVQMLIMIPLAIKYKYVNFRTLFWALFILILFFIPNVIYDLTHNFYSANGFSILIKVLVNGGFNNLFHLLSQRVDAFIWNFRLTFSDNTIKSFCLLLIIYVGVYLFVKDKRNIVSQKLFLFYLALTPLTKILILFFYPGVIQAWYLLDLVVVYCFLLGIILGYFLDRKRLNLLAIAVLLGLVVIFVFRTYIIFRNEFDLTLGVDRIAQSTVIKYIYSDAKRQQFNYTPHRFDLTYLFWWYGKNKYGLNPSNVPQKVNYYILDANDPEDRVLPKDISGRVVDTKVFPYGFTVKKIIQ